MGWRDTISNVVTFGGHQKLQLAQAQYAETHGRYLISFESEKAYRTRADDTVKSLGALTVASFKALRAARKLVMRETAQDIVPTSHSLVAQPLTSNFERIEKLVVRYSEVKAAAGGMSAGSAAVIGSWSVVSVLGTASTGTAIATLSGAAATNATFAWFGGGALAAGGAGIAGGTALLGGVALAPVIGFMSWHSRAKAEQVVEETNRLKVELHKLGQAIEQHSARFAAADAAKGRLIAPAEELICVQRQVQGQLFPVWFLSYGVRIVRSWFGQPFYREDELAQLDELSEAIVNFETVWRESPPGPNHA